MTEPDQRPLRVGLFTNNYRPMLGGVATAVETTRAALERLGHRVVVVAPQASHPPAGESGVLRVPAVPAPTYPDFGLPLPIGPRLARVIGDLDLDVFHAHHPFLLGGSARRLARRAGRPLVFTYHTLYDKYAHYVPLPRRPVAWSAVAWSRRFADSAQLVVAPSSGLASRLRAQGVRQPILVLPTGVDLERFRPGNRLLRRHALGLPTSSPILLWVGRLDREKNVGFLLEAFDRVAAAHSQAILLLIGRGMQSAALAEQASRMLAANRIRFVGGVEPERVHHYLQAVDALVFASVTETQGLSVVEAMAAGLPVVAVRAMGVEEVVVDGVSGLLVPPDVPSFASAVLALLGDVGLRAKLAAGARAAALPFATDAMGLRLVRAYRCLRAGKRPV